MQIDFKKLRASYQGNADNQTTRIGYFSLKNDGDTALVRFAHTGPEDFDVVFSHEVEIDGRTRKINCLKGRGDPDSACPFCRDGEKGNLRIYIHLIEYTKDAQGNIVATPKVWERPISYGDTLADYADEYAPLSDYIFKIKRNGARGSQSTTYTITPCNATAYNAEEYPPHPEFFTGYKALGRIILEKTPEEMEKILESVQPMPITASREDARTYVPMTGSVPATPVPVIIPEEERATIVTPQQETASAYAPQRPAPVQPENMSQPANNPFARPRRFYQN